MRILWLLGLLAAGCAKKPGAVVDAAVKSPHPDLVCPAGTTPSGTAPPAGFEVWCYELSPSGQPVRNGPSIAWHPNEQRKAQGAFALGRPTGAWESWYANGQLEKTGSYVNGREEGVWVAYHPGGARASEGSWVDGKENGKWAYWAEDGSSRTEGTWSLGNREGTWVDYDASDVPVREKEWRGGRMLAQRVLSTPAPATPAPTPTPAPK